MINEREKLMCQAIVNVFETGTPRGDYGKVTVMSGDNGGLTYGRSQTTLMSGNLYKLLKMYTEQEEIFDYQLFQNEIKIKLPAIKARLPELNHDTFLKRTLHILGESRIMRWTQDQFFDQVYWRPAADYSSRIGMTLPLSYAVVYDSFIHGGIGIVRRRFPEVPPSKGGEEKKWVRAYVLARHEWLLNHRIELLNKTVYRTNTFKVLIAHGNWSLFAPLQANGVTIENHDLFDQEDMLSP